METKLHLITEIARKDRKCHFKNLIHVVNQKNLYQCFYQLRKDSASGIDGVTFQEYERNLVENLAQLVKRMKSFSYHPQAVRRHYIPKANGKMRPLGIPCLEDKIVHQAFARILTAIYEADFLDFSYGFRPKRNCHQALNRLDKSIMTQPINYIIDADIKGFFDHVNHQWMLRCLQERISDQKFLRYIKRFLKAGVMEDGKWQPSEQGTPQGGIISPILANIYLHYVLDLWMLKVVQPHCRGRVFIVRYADDFIIGVQYQDEAEQILAALRQRLGKFGLELAADKTQIIAFGRRAFEQWQQGGTRPKTFNFLGFTHFCEQTRNGKFKVGRTTERKRYRAKIKEMNQWLKDNRNRVSVERWWQTVGAKLVGHFRYYGVSGNYRAIERFHYLTERLAFKWMNRCSQKKRRTWEEFKKYLKRHPLPRPKIYHHWYTLYGY